MNRELVKHLILYIVAKLRDMDAPVSTIRLVKCLYLIDLEYYNRHFKTLTGIEWVKYKYGPYFFDWGNAIRSTGLDLEIEEVLTEHGPGRIYKVYDEQSISGIVDFGAEQLINRVLQKWGLEDRDVLLEYVYGTMPVKHAEHGEPLDFTLETDHLLLEQAANMATDFLTLDELITDYEKQANNEK